MHKAVQLGLRYLMGVDAAQDARRGVALIEKAARSGDAEAAYLSATIASAPQWHSADWNTALEHLVVAAERDYPTAQSSLRILAAGPLGDVSTGDAWRKLRDSIDLDAWRSIQAAETISESPYIRVIPGFVSPAVCDWFVDRAREHLTRATIYDNITGGNTEDYRRTNSQCDLNVANCGVLTFVLRTRIASMTNRPDLAMEVPKVLHYAPGETFAEHFDYLQPDTPAFARELALRGQRADTFLIYLNDDFEGGETCFTRIGLSHKGAKGDAILFANITPDGLPDENTIHAGLPPTSGEKWLFSQWIRDIPPA